MCAEVYSTSQLMACVLSRELRDREVVISGTNGAIPLSACRLAFLTHAPNLTYIAGATGTVNPILSPLPASSSDYLTMRGECHLTFQDIIDVEGKPRIDVFFAGGMQIDRFGNTNLVCVGDYDNPKLRGPGTIGLSFLSRARRYLTYTQAHSKRVFVEKVDFVSGVGFLDGPESWLQADLVCKGPSLVVTPLCAMDFAEDTRLMRLRSVHPGVSVEQVVENTGFALVIPDVVPTTPEPSDTELDLLREIDSLGILR